MYLDIYTFIKIKFLYFLKKIEIYDIINVLYHNIYHIYIHYEKTKSKYYCLRIKTIKRE